MKIKNKKIEITMFGEFSIKIGNTKLADDTGRAKQIWNLLEYLIANRFNYISQEKLIDILWEDESSDNPVNALKNLIYRIRNMLAETFKDTKYDFIVLKRNTYCWNNDLPCVIDIEEFENAWKIAMQDQSSDEAKTEYFKKAAQLYKGEFLPKTSMEDWVVLNSTRYNRIFSECIHGLNEILIKQKRYDEIIAICEKAISIDCYDESVHELLINTYLKANEKQKAVAHFEYASKLFYEKLGIKLSDNLVSMMKNIIKTMHGVENDFAVIHDDLKESESIDSAYFCDYEVFKNLYRIEARSAERFGQSVFVALLSLELSDKVVINTKIISNSMNLLKKVILKSLRKSDVVSIFSNSQYVLMLPALTFENGQAVLQRIVKNFNEENKNHNISLDTKINPLSPTE